jgi:PKD repeat protein
LLAITASFTRTVTKWTLKCDATRSKSPKTIASYFWNWGDGKNDTITNRTAIAFHTYATASTVTVALTITDINGAKDVVSYSVVIVGNVIPTASFTSVITAYTVAGTSTSTDSDGTVVGYEWNWGDNTTLDTTANPSHTYVLAGTYTIRLKVTD